MRIISVKDIEPIIADKTAVINAVKAGFIAHGLGDITQPSPTQMLFQGAGDQLRGDCHVKTAYSDKYKYFCVKVASGFYDNAEKGLPVNDGLLLLLSSDTGAPLALFQDNGLLTSVRTAAAGALAVDLLGSNGATLGIAGAGHQAEMQARWISAYTSVSEIIVWSRTHANVIALADRLKDLAIRVTAVSSVTELCRQADIIVTTTPSTSPIITSENIRAGHRIVALGADSPGKMELDAQILANAAQIITDDHEQCLHHGEFGNAVRAGLIADDSDISLGACLADRTLINRAADATTIVDLTGLGAQDLAVASFVWESILT